MNAAAALAADPSDAPQSEFARLISLAKSRSADDRQRLLLAVAALCDANPPGVELSPILSRDRGVISQEVQQLIQQITP